MARPRSFDAEEALDDLMALFWERGFDGVSMQDIEARTGLKKQSLYRIFGSKRAMYLETLRRYGRREIVDGTAPLEGPGDARARFAQFFGRIIDETLATGDRRGCYLCNASVDQAQLDGPSREEIEQLMGEMQARFEAGLAASEPYSSDPSRRAAKAAELMAAHFGLRVLIRAGMPEPMLRDVAAGAVASI